MPQLPELPRPTRRETIIASVTLATGGGLATLLADPARADVTTDELTIPDADYADDDGQPSAVTLDVAGSFAFQTDAPADTWRARLAVSSDGTDWEPLAATTGDAGTSRMSGEYELSASLFEHPNLDAATFTAPLGATITERVFVRVQFDALDGADESLVSATANDSVTLEITNTSVEASANVAGEGSVAFDGGA